MAYKFQLDSAIMSGALVQEGAGEFVGNLSSTAIISGSGNALVGGSLTAGQSKFVVHATSGLVTGVGLNNTAGGITNAGAIAGATSIDGSGDLTMGTITMTGMSVDADGDTLVKTLGGATTISGSGLGSFGGGLAAGQGSFTVSSAGAIAGATSIDASGDLTVASITNAEFTVDASGNTDIDGTLNVQGIPTFQAAAVFSGGVTTANAIAGATSIDGSGDLTMATITMTGFTVDADGDTSAKSLISTSTISGSGTLTANDLAITQTSLFSGDVALSGASDTAIAVAADSLYFLDATSGKVRRDSFADYAAALVLSEPGLASAGGKLQYDPNSLASASVNVAQDFFSFVDAGDSDIPKKDSIADLVTAMAGGGLNATNGVLSTQGGSVTAGGDGVTLSEGYNYFTGTVNASCTLPGAPSVGDVVTIKAGNTTVGQKITINRAGSHLIDNDATKLELESPYAAVTLVYVVANDWRLV